MNETDYDELAIWQDTLDEVVAGRTKGLKCPYCGAPGLEVETTAGTLTIKCNDCGKGFSGRLRF